MKIITKYDETIHKSTTTIYSDGKKFIGVAQAHKEDFDFASKLTGQYISEMKALIRYYDYKANQHFSLVEVLSNTYKHTKELKGTCEQIRAKGLEFVKLAKIYDNEVQDYIEKKDDYYKRLRELRQGTLERTEFEYLPDYVESLEDKKAKDEKAEEIANKRSMSDSELWEAFGLGE